MFINQVSSPEDTNIVTSSEEYQPPAKVPRISTTSTGSQTPKKVCKNLSKIFTKCVIHFLTILCCVY